MSNFLNFFNLFCFHEKVNTSKTQNYHSKNEIEIVYSKPLDISMINETLTIILQKKMFKMICHIIPNFINLDADKKTNHIITHERNFKTFNGKTERGCWNFKSKKSINTSLLEETSEQLSFFKNKDLIADFISKIVDNFVIIYNYSNEIDILSLFNHQVFIF